MRTPVHSEGLVLSRRAILFIPIVAAAPRAGLSFPVRTVTIVVPFAAGGGVDHAARTFAQALQAKMGWNVVVENRAGGNTSIGVAAVASSQPDGHTLLMTSALVVTNAVMTSDASAQFKQLSHIARLTNAPNVWVASAGLPFSDLKTFDAWAARAAVSYGSSGVFSNQHLNGLELLNRMRLQGTHVPYKGGAQALPDLLEGRITFMITSATEVLPHIRSGKLRALAQSGVKRSQALQDVPTFEELGLGANFTTSWYGLASPRGLPINVLADIVAACAAALSDSRLAAAFRHGSIEVSPLFGAALQAFIDQERERIELFRASDARN